MLSIKEFSEMCHLTPQALRFYHGEGLLVPAHVDERTGHRAYDFTQVEQAMTVTLLRDAGLSVKHVRQAIDEPDQALTLIDRHHEEIQRQRAAQDDAIQAARAVYGSQPEITRRRLPEMTVLSRMVYGTPAGRDAQEWAEAERMIEAAARELAEEAGDRAAGRPWRTLALETPEQDRRVLDGEGPFWIVKVAVEGMPGVTQEARDEVSIFMPGRNTMAKYCTAMLRFLDVMPLEDESFVNFAKMTLEVRPDGVLMSAPVEQRPA
ncbi:MerR family transcriptional regulator [Actinoplanes sp. G11-F43]|uniref:MerR family transcriptional regulator n=1 Tax=Actinoplanes sp. G11-F43 TaxID=3424130 RepID=UPI003D3596DD